MAFSYNTSTINSGPRLPPGANIVFVPRPPHIPAGTVQRVDHINGQSSFYFPTGVTTQGGAHTNQGNSPFSPDTPATRLLVSSQKRSLGSPPEPVKQPSQERSLPDEWACKKCTFDNPLGVTICHMCDNPKETATIPIVPQQLHWRCQACSFINTGSKCEMCKCPYFDNQEEHAYSDNEESQPTRSYPKTFFDYVKTLDLMFFCIVLIVSILLL